MEQTLLENDPFLRRDFKVDRKTMRRWGRALQSGEAEQLVQAFAGMVEAAWLR